MQKHSLVRAHTHTCTPMSTIRNKISSANTTYYMHSLQYGPYIGTGRGAYFSEPANIVLSSDHTRPLRYNRRCENAIISPPLRPCAASHPQVCRIPRQASGNEGVSRLTMNTRTRHHKYGTKSFVAVAASVPSSVLRDDENRLNALSACLDFYSPTIAANNEPRIPTYRISLSVELAVRVVFHK